MSAPSSGPRSSRGRSSVRSGPNNAQDGIGIDSGHAVANRSQKGENGNVGVKAGHGGKDSIQQGMDNFFKKKKNREIAATAVCLAESVNGSNENSRPSDKNEGGIGSTVKALESRATKGKKVADRDDVNQGAELLLGFFQAKCEGMESGANGTEQIAAKESTDCAEGQLTDADKDKTANVVATRNGAGMPVDEDWAWEPSCHEGLYTFHDGRKRWYHCMYCPYFNDRLYHSKMHFERIHVKQGKSMPRKRKYMDPAGSKAGEAACLPPSTQKQPEPKYSRIRRPGDKWLKTAAESGSHTGFRYQSVHDIKPGASRSCSPQSNHDVEAPSDENLMNSNDIQRHSLILSPAAKLLHCWESSKAIQRGVEKGDFGKYWKPVYTFKSEVGPAASMIFHRKELEVEPHAEPILSSAAKRWQWWWYKPAGSPVDFEQYGPDIAAKESYSNMIQPPSERELHQNSAQSNSSKDQASKTGESGAPMQVKTEISSAEAHVSARSAASVLGNGMSGASHTKPTNDLGSLNYDSMLSSNGMVKNGGRGRGPEGAGARAKRVWRRWDPNEENALREAVDLLGTKDWAAIHERMGTDRSIKQLQDHWNDTKKERVAVGAAAR